MSRKLARVKTVTTQFQEWQASASSYSASLVPIHLITAMPTTTITCTSVTVTNGVSSSFTTTIIYKLDIHVHPKQLTQKHGQCTWASLDPEGGLYGSSES